ncbi:MAG: hypothetical protein KAR40_06265 [Candidatus Sabulitectum sp.]|nr:hypothetical protein [Candidatus Sabulitectum sp.]
MTNKDELHKKFIEFQVVLLDETKTIIEKHAPGLPYFLMKTYMEKIGGAILMVTGHNIGGTSHPFRLRVTAEDGVIKKVLGWG